jgi:opacity protein-like surface antigen
MVSKRFLLGVLLCCGALGACATVPAGASATWTELCTQAVTLENTEGWYSEGNCKTAGVSTDKWHWAITGGTVITRWLLGGIQEFDGTLAGVSVEVTCEGVTNTSGSDEQIEEGGVKKVKGKEMVLVYSKCGVVKPAGKGCKVKGGGFTSKSLKSLAAPSGETSSVKFEPESGTEIAPIALESCSLATLNSTFSLAGSFTGVVPKSERSLLEFTATSGSSLKLGGNSATYLGNTHSQVKETGETISIGN